MRIKLEKTFVITNVYKGEPTNSISVIFPFQETIELLDEDAKIIGEINLERDYR